MLYRCKYQLLNIVHNMFYMQVALRIINEGNILQNNMQKSKYIF